LRLLEQLFHGIVNNLLAKPRQGILDGADVNHLIKVNQKELFTPLKWAIRKKNIDMIELLLNHGASVLNTKKILDETECAFLDGVLSELLIEEFAKPQINIRKVQSLLSIGASLNYPENPLWTLCNNARLSESNRLMILELLLQNKELEPDIIEKLVTHPRWVINVSKILFDHIQRDTHIGIITYFLKLGARIDLPLPYVSPLMFIFDEEINKMETASEKAKRLHCDEILEVMTGTSTHRSFSV
jgi:hypothetical protein